MSACTLPLRASTASASSTVDDASMTPAEQSAGTTQAQQSAGMPASNAGGSSEAREHSPKRGIEGHHAVDGRGLSPRLFEANACFSMKTCVGASTGAGACSGTQAQSVQRAPASEGTANNVSGAIRRATGFGDRILGSREFFRTGRICRPTPKVALKVAGRLRFLTGKTLAREGSLEGRGERAGAPRVLMRFKQFVRILLGRASAKAGESTTLRRSTSGSTRGPWAT